MAPKAAPPPPVEEPPAEKEVQEEEEEGDGKVAFSLECLGVKDLPCGLETCIAFSGVCRENRSEPAEKSDQPSGWELAKNKFIRLQDQALYDDLAERELVVSVLDAARENAVIGTVSVSLLSLMHERTEVGGDYELKLTERYYQKWWPGQEEEEPPPDPKAKAKAKAKAAPAPEEEEEPPVVRAPDFVPPKTIISFRVTVPELVGPAEDRDCWTTITLRVGGVFGLPDELTGGLAAAEEVKSHNLRYLGTMLGEDFGAGALAKPSEVEEAEEEEAPPPAEDGEEAPPPPQKPEIPLRERQERFGLSVRFAQKPREDCIVRYRGAGFLRDFVRMLNHVGGVWFYLNPEPKNKDDEDAAALAKAHAGKAWLDLSGLIQRGVSSRAEVCCPLAAATLEGSGAYVRLSFEMSRDITPAPVPPEQQVQAHTLAPRRAAPTGRFPKPEEAVQLYKESVKRSFDRIVFECTDGAGPGSAGVIEKLKKVEAYDEVKGGLRSAAIQIFRERVRKDVKAVPGQPLSEQQKAELISATYAHLRGSMADVLDEIRKKVPPDDVGRQPSRRSASRREPALAEAAAAPTPKSHGGHSPFAGVSPPSTGRARDLNATNLGSHYGGSPKSGRDSPDGSPAGGEEVAAPVVAAPTDPVAAAIAEGVGRRRTRGALGSVNEPGSRNARLAFEAEMVGNWDRAAQLLQNRLALEALRRDPAEWVSYAKFCCRSRGRQAAAEEALRQAVKLLADPAVQHTREIAMEVDLMLACLLVDRGRAEEAIKVFRAWHEKDLADPLLNFLLGLGLFLAGEDAASQHLEAAGKPRSWFMGLRDFAAVAEKLKGDSGGMTSSYVACVEKLLDFGLSSLAFSFLDQCEILSPEETASEPVRLLDAKAAALERDFQAALKALEPLLGAGSASQETWRLAGECHFQLQDFDKALQAVQQALGFEAKLEDSVGAAVYIRYGACLVAKKRWKASCDAFLKSIQLRPTAEAWSGVAYAEYKADNTDMAYEALCEAALLDNQRSDVWAQLSLVHLRQENWDSADHCLRQTLAHGPDCDELLLEAAVEYNRKERSPEFSEAAARCSLRIRDCGMAHAALADALERQGEKEQSVLEAEIALKQLTNQPDQRKAVFDKALKLCEELEDPALLESLQAAKKLADEQQEKRPGSPA